MLTTAIILFVVAAGLGLTILIPVLKDRPTPKASVLFHGIFAASGLLLLVLAVAGAGDDPAGKPVTSLIVFLIAAAGGFVLLTQDLTKRGIPKWLAIVHPVVAAVGLILLLVFVLGR